MVILLFALALAPRIGPQSYAASVDFAKGKIFTADSPVKPAYLYERSRSEEGDKTISRVRYLDKTGNVLIDEQTTYLNGKLVSYTYHQHQTKEEGEIEVRDGKVFYTFTSEGKTQKDDQDAEPSMVVPDMIPKVLADSWGTLMAGDDVKVRFLLLEKLDSYGFKFFKDKERAYAGVPAVDITMKPSSIFIAALAPSFTFTLEKAPPHRFLESNVRLPIRVAKKNPPQSRNDFQAIDGRVVFEYPFEDKKKSD
jgi:hypothetical protein